MRSALVASLVALLVTLSACGLFEPQLKDGVYLDEHVAYNVGQPGAGWRRIDLQQANAAWFNDALSASLMVNSHCEGVKDSPLEGLTEDLLMGMTDRDVVSQEKKPWSRREALETVATGRLDGVERKLALFVLKKDGCVYDIVMDASPEHFARALPAFAAVRDGFDVGARRDRS